MKNIHINCDLGEGGEYDDKLMPLISACNIACGGHAGNLESMHRTVGHAMEHHVEIGAHPSYPDKENFGRRSLAMEEKDLKQSLVAQILSLKQIAEAEGGKLVHVKPHGALYNDAAKDEKTARMFLEVMEEFDDALTLYAPADSVISKLAEGRIKVVFEAFADRNYNPDYSLVSRSEPMALIAQKEDVFKHLYTMFSRQIITCKNGQELPCRATTFCMHSDTPNSVEILRYLHEKLKQKDIQIYKND